MSAADEEELLRLCAEEMSPRSECDSPPAVVRRGRQSRRGFDVNNMMCRDNHTAAWLADQIARSSSSPSSSPPISPPRTHTTPIFRQQQNNSSTISRGVEIGSILRPRCPSTPPTSPFYVVMQEGCNMDTNNIFTFSPPSPISIVDSPSPPRNPPVRRFQSGINARSSVIMKRKASDCGERPPARRPTTVPTICGNSSTTATIVSRDLEELHKAEEKAMKNKSKKRKTRKANDDGVGNGKGDCRQSNDDDKLTRDRVTRESLFGPSWSEPDKKAWLESLRKIDPVCNNTARNLSRTWTPGYLKQPGDFRQRAISHSSDASTDVISNATDSQGFHSKNQR